METILITARTGNIGGAVAAELLRGGVGVRALGRGFPLQAVRSKSPGARVESGVLAPSMPVVRT